MLSCKVVLIAINHLRKSAKSAGVKIDEVKVKLFYYPVSHLLTPHSHSTW